MPPAPIRISLSAAAISALALAGCAGIGGPVFEARSLAIDEAAAARLVTAYRAERGLGPVELDQRLNAVAAAQAKAMAERDRLSHNLGVGRALPKRLAEGGYDWSVTAENIGAGYPTLDDAMSGWQASPGHRENLLKDGVTEIGIGAAMAPGSTYRTFWALVLAAPREPTRRAPAGG